MDTTGSWSTYYYNNVSAIPPYVSTPANRFVYVKQNYVQPQPILPPTQKPTGNKVHINPNFNKKVFVNPNFQGNSAPTPVIPNKIHINPNLQNIKLSILKSKPQATIDNGGRTTKIHVNPNILKTVPIPLENKATNEFCRLNKVVYSSRTKLIRKPERKRSVSNSRKKRLSICSKYKIVKSSLQKKKKLSNSLLNTTLITPSKYKLRRLKTIKVKSSPKVLKRKNKYKLDNRISNKAENTNVSTPKQLNTGYLTKNKRTSLLKIGEVFYKKSVYTLKRASDAKKARSLNISKGSQRTISTSKYKLVRKKSDGKNSPQNNQLQRRNNSKMTLR